MEEVKYADLLLIVVDSSDPYYLSHKKVTEDTLAELGANEIPRIYVMNKADLVPEREGLIPEINSEKVFISAKRGDGIIELLRMIDDIVSKAVKPIEAIIPYSSGELLNRLHQNANIELEDYRPEGVYIKAECPEHMYNEVMLNHFGK